jgi:hypothetical protein
MEHIVQSQGGSFGSIPIKSEGSRDGQAGEAGPGYQRPGVSKLAQETIRLKSAQRWFS